MSSLHRWGTPKMADLDIFRRETAAWLEANAPESLFGQPSKGFDGFWGGVDPEYPGDDRRAWFEQMVDKGWTAPTWPTTYGVADFRQQRPRFSTKKCTDSNSPPARGHGAQYVGPVLLAHGTESQRGLLPAITGPDPLLQGYSEPSAGSDLASLRTRGVVDEDELVVSGQKIWTSYADVSDWCFYLVRTNPEVKQLGISFVLIDLRSRA